MLSKGLKNIFSIANTHHTKIWMGSKAFLDPLLGGSKSSLNISLSLSLLVVDLVDQSLSTPLSTPSSQVPMNSLYPSTVPELHVFSTIFIHRSSPIAIFFFQTEAVYSFSFSQAKRQNNSLPWRHQTLTCSSLKFDNKWAPILLILGLPLQPWQGIVSRCYYKIETYAFGEKEKGKKMNRFRLDLDHRILQ
jgi:hypothetical protein